MTEADASTVGAQRHTVAVAKYEGGRTPADGEPDETIVVSGWLDADGHEITDAARIAALERKLEGYGRG